MIDIINRPFLCLAHLINVFNACLCNPIIISDLSVVTSSFSFVIVEDNQLVQANGIILKLGPYSYKWKLSETNIFVIRGLLHSLGYANNELLLDSEFQLNDISVYWSVK